jgi:glutathione S-transferase
LQHPSPENAAFAEIPCFFPANRENRSGDEFAIADLGVLSRLIPSSGYVHGDKPTSIDAGIYGFLANIHFYDIDTPLKQCVASHPNLVRHCEAIHAAVSK